MSLAIPAFTDLTKAAKTVLYGDVAGEGAFTPGIAQVKAQTATADGVIFNVKAAVSPAGQVVPSLTTMYSPTKQLMLMGIWGAGGSLTGSATLSSVLNVPGLQATLTTTPPVLGGQLAAHSLTLDYVTAAARLRALATPADSAKPFSAPPKGELSATTVVGPCVVGARVAADAATGKLTQWSVGANWTRMVADPAGKGEVSSLAGQQIGVLVTDAAPGAATASRAATLSYHQLLHGGETSLAAEYSLPISPMGNQPDHGYALSLGVARRISDTGGLVKGRLDHTGQVSLLYQQTVPGVGQLALSCQLDPLAVTKVAPSVGFSLNVL